MRYLLIAWLLMAAPAIAAPIGIGGTTFPLGEAAFPTASTCIDTSGCPGDLLLLDASLDPVPRQDALLGHDLSLVVIDMEATNVFRLTFSPPIVNQPGADLYLAQAEFTGDMDLEDGIHAVQIRFVGTTTWHTVASDQFIRDTLAGTPIVTFSDPELKQVGYFPWITTQDLSDFGFAPGASISGFDLRGLPDDTGQLDLAIAGSLNVPEPRTAILLVLGLLSLGLSRGSAVAVARRGPVPGRGSRPAADTRSPAPAR